MHCVYILKSLSSGRYYIGETSDIAQRVLRHNAGHVPSTKNRGPWALIWTISQESKADARILERKLKNLKSRARLEKFMLKHGKMIDPDSDNYAEHDIENSR